MAESPPPPPIEQLIPAWLQRLSLVAAVLTIPSVLLDEVNGLPDWAAILANALNWAVWSVFLITAIVWLHRSPNWWASVKKNPILPLIVLLTTPIAPAGLQMFRLLRLGALLGAAHHARRLFSLEGLRYAGILLVLVVVGGGLVFSAVERGAQDVSIGDGIWWAIVTVTTVGYGDIVPHTEAGRGVAVIVMVTGIGTAALLVGAASQRFVIGSDDGDPSGSGVSSGESDDANVSLAELQREIRGLRADLAALRAELRPPGPGS